ncbi:Hemopexin [Penicillium angulare]|uniref:Hemopexin n=1 Tax=Penicillium angulare TaxID=116970 RepID=A0A9W9F5G6_9EURO|nr:Hemopexin [Penicillium angulare]
MVDAGYIEPTNGQGYVFKGNRYVCIKVIPETIIDQIKSLVKAGFEKVDAIIPVPQNKGEIWVFSGTQHARIDFGNDSIVFGPAPIAENWPSLVKLGFSTIDAIFPTPGQPNYAYVFNKDKYARITLTPGKPESDIYWGPAAISKHWPNLANAGFTAVDTVIPVPGVPSDGYFFQGDQYIRLTVEPDQTQTKVVFGPASVKKHWPSLDNL